MYVYNCRHAPVAWDIPSPLSTVFPSSRAPLSTFSNASLISDKSVAPDSTSKTPPI